MSPEGARYAQTIKPAVARPKRLATFAAALALLLGAAAFAQPVGAPPPTGTLDPTIASPAVSDPYVQLAQAPGYPENAPLGVATPPPTGSGPPDGMPPGTRPGAFQKFNFSAFWMPRMEGDSVGITGMSTNIVFGLPFPERYNPLLITPAYRVQFLEGPNFTDLPPRVHDAEITFHHPRRINDRWRLDAAVTIGAYADDHSFDASDAVQASGRGLGIYDFKNGWKGVVGVVVVNRAGSSIFPAAGLTYEEPDFKFDLLFPRPRVAWRLPGCVRPGYNERWFYVQGGFGGNRWAVRRDSGADDILAYSDLRLLVGLERKLIGGLSRKWEFGYVFDRDIEYEVADVESAVDDSVFFRGGVTY